MDKPEDSSGCEYYIKAHQLCIDLNDIMMHLNTIKDVDEMLHMIVHGACKAIDCESARIAMRVGEHWVIRYGYNFPEEMLGQGFTNEELPHATLAMITKRPVAIEDAYNDDRANKELMEKFQLRSILVLPLMDMETVIGVLTFGYHSKITSFSDMEIDYAEKVAVGVAIALQNARQYQDLQQSKKELEEANHLSNALISTNAIIYSTHDFNEIMIKVLQLATDAIGAETAMIFSKEEGDNWVVRYVYKLSQSLVGHSFTSSQVLHTAVTAVTREPLVVTDAYNDANTDEAFVKMLEIRSLLDFPLIVKGEVIGDLTFHCHSTVAGFNERQVEFVRKLQSSISLALENARLIEALSESEFRQKEAQRIGNYGYFHYDTRTKKLSLSDGLLRIFRRQPEMGELTIEEFCNSYAVDPGCQEMKELMENEDECEFDAKINCEDAEVYVHVVMGALKDANGEIIARFGTAHDISERRRHERELKQAHEAAEAGNRAKNQFLANMSHELRTPLSGIMGMQQLLLDGYAEPLKPDQQELLAKANRSAQSFLRVINDILDLSRVDTGRLVVEEKPFSVIECVREAIELFSVDVQQKGLQLDFSIAEGMPAIWIGDFVRLRQVLVNLIGNAVKFTPHGKVVVEVKTGNKMDSGKTMLSFVVSDTGIGIPDEKKHLLFRSFSQIEDSDNRKYGGAGLGLAISSRLIEMMGGKLTCESIEGSGSSFSFTLMLEEAVEWEETPESPPSAPLVAPVAEQEDRPRILVAEDDPAASELLKRVFELRGMDVDVVATGRDAVERWEAGEYDLILMDIQMPIMDGITATRIIRQKEIDRGGHIAIVAVTAHAFLEDKERCLAAGMDDYLTKPLDFKKGIEMIMRLAKRKGQ